MVARLQAELRDYPWSSYRAMIGLGPNEEWLVTKDTLARWGMTLWEQKRNYAEFVEQGLIGAIEDPAEEAKAHFCKTRRRLPPRADLGFFCTWWR